MEPLKLNSFNQTFFRLVLICTLLQVLIALQGASAQSITISPSSVSSIQTSRSINNIDLIKTGTNNTSGFRFYQSASLRGGLFYNDNDNTLNFTHTPSMAGIVWNTDSQRAGIGVKLPGGRLHILANSTDAVPHILIQENNDGDGGRLNFENFGVANKRWTLYGRNSNTTTLSSNVLNIYHSSFGNVAQFTGDGNTRMNGFTQLGADSPKIKVKKFTGVLAADDETLASIDVPFAKIISFTGLVQASNGPFLGRANLVKPEAGDNNYNYGLGMIINYSQNNTASIYFYNVPSTLEGQPYTVYVVFEE